MTEPGSNVSVQPTAPEQPDAAAAASFDPSVPADIAGAAEAAFPTETSEGASWWSPNMPLLGATGYDENFHDTLSYSPTDFRLQ